MIYGPERATAADEKRNRKRPRRRLGNRYQRLILILDATALSGLIGRRGTSEAGLTNRGGPLLNGVAADSLPDEPPMDTESNFVCAGTLEDIKAKGRLVVHGRHRPVLLVHEVGTSSRSTIAAPIWVSRSIAAALRTAS